MRAERSCVQLLGEAKEVRGAVRSRSPYIGILIVVSLALTSCGGALKLGQQGRLGLATATPGIEAKGGAEVPPVAATMPAEVAQASPVPSVVADVPSAVPPTDVPPTEAPPAVSPTINPVLENVQLPTGTDLEARWRNMQVDRAPFDAPRTYVSPSYQLVWWFDPIFGQLVPLGEAHGDIPVQATFRIKGQWVNALEIPYHINQDFDFKLPDPVLKRMQAAGTGEWREVFIYQTRDIQPK